MITLISLLVVLVGCANWLTIGLLQFDFVAGLFGSQSNVFSRIVYVLVGVAAIIMAVNLIKNKGKVTFNLKKLKDEKTPKLAHSNAESGQDYGKSHSTQNHNQNPQASQNQQQYQAFNGFSNSNNYNSQQNNVESAQDYSHEKHFNPNTQNEYKDR